MKPTYQEVRKHYPRTESRAALYECLGWSDLIELKAYEDTCAIRMSYALLRARVRLTGASMEVKAGPLKGKRIEQRQAALSRMLTREWGTPEVFKSERAANTGIGKRQGVVSFFKVEGGNGGHIDMITMGEHGFLDCARSCYFSATTIWFWPLD